MSKPPPESRPKNGKYQIVIGESVRESKRSSKDVFTVRYETSRKPSTIDESAPGYAEFGSQRVNFDYGTKSGGVLRMSGTLKPADKDYILIFEGNEFRLEKASKHVYHTGVDRKPIKSSSSAKSSPVAGSRGDGAYMSDEKPHTWRSSLPTSPQQSTPGRTELPVGPVSPVRPISPIRPVVSSPKKARLEPTKTLHEPAKRPEPAKPPRELAKPPRESKPPREPPAKPKPPEPKPKVPKVSAPKGEWDDDEDEEGELEMVPDVTSPTPLTLPVEPTKPVEPKAQTGQIGDKGLPELKKGPNSLKTQMVTVNKQGKDSGKNSSSSSSSASSSGGSSESSGEVSYTDDSTSSND